MTLLLNCTQYCGTYDKIIIVTFPKVINIRFVFVQTVQPREPVRVKNNLVQGFSSGRDIEADIRSQKEKLSNLQRRQRDTWVDSEVGYNFER